MRKFLLLIVFFFVPALVSAAPWCLVMDEVSNCNYMTAEACYKAVSNFGGSCRGNPAEFGVKGNNKWCVVSENGRDCRIANQRGCLRLAQKLGGGCVENRDYIDANDFVRKFEEAKRNGEF